MHVITGLETGGAERMLYRLLAEQVKSSIEPTVVSLMGNGVWGIPIKELGIPVYTVGMDQGKPSLLALRRLRKLTAELGPDLIHSWMYHANIATLFSTILQNHCPIVWHVHHSANGLQHEKWLTIGVVYLGATLSRTVERIVYCGPQTAQQHERLGYDSTRTQVIPNGTDCTEYRPNPSTRMLIRYELGITEHVPVVGHVARLHPMKDQGNLLRAANIVWQEYPDVHFVFAGRDVTNTNEVLEKLLEELRFPSQVHLLGERRDIPSLMTSFDVFTLSSLRSESFPLVLGEAMATEVPCVTTNVGDAPWIVGETGKVVSPNDSNALARSIIELLSLPVDVFAETGRLARQRIVNEFSIQSVAQKFAGLYEEVCR